LPSLDFAETALRHKITRRGIFTTKASNGMEYPATFATPFLRPLSQGVPPDGQQSRVVTDLLA
jgi:hypothetical protein